ncbi:hypothetical protein PtoMrB4_40240 [Metapseudomonas otitidis]|uniref:DUF2784 domain-containing protein n=2 Tax=Metapseudomonas otitidis TaxID=319939 RepID=A0A679GTU3_9GAMM|nr:hypothetical protein PtoMrB4_40240 [Pseudomonas otitidis]
MVLDFLAQGGKALRPFLPVPMCSDFSGAQRVQGVFIPAFIKEAARGCADSERMIERIAADAVVLVHLAFILFVLLGGVAVLVRTWMAMLHLPAVAWGACMELLHLRCPLTDLENSLRHAAGESGYPGGFVERYILPVIYPAGLTDAIQLWLGAVVISLNLLVYGLVLWRGLKRRTAF